MVYFMKHEDFCNKKYGKSLIGFIFVAIVICIAISSLFNTEEFDIVNYRVNEGVNSFTVTGKIEISGYDCDRVILTATALDNKGQEIYLAQKFDIDGDGEYSFILEGLYLESGTSISKVYNFALRER